MQRIFTIMNLIGGFLFGLAVVALLVGVWVALP